MNSNYVSVLPEMPHVNEVVEYSEKDEPLFQELAAVLSKHGALDRFGISLLHRHFDLNDNEVLLEITHVKDRRQVTSPVSREELETMHILETSWRLDSKGRPQVEARCQKENTSIPPQHVDR